MKAAYIEAVGPPEAIQIGDLRVPEPGPGEVLVKVGAAALNPIDLYLRSGFIAMPMAFPYVIACDLAGTVEKVGINVSRFKPGDRVWGSNQGVLGRQGVASEFASVSQDWLYPTPDNLSDVEAASMALTGITAHLGLFQHGKLRAGETVYVPGGSGGVGSMVVQMAKAAGARVVTSAGAPERVELCTTLGADLAINYKTDDIPAKIREFCAEGIDVWYENQRDPNLEEILSLLRLRGRLVVIAGRAARPVLPFGLFYPRNVSIHGFAMYNATPDEQRVCGEAMNQWAASGQLKPLIGKVFPLDEAVQAHTLLEENTLKGAGNLHGKVVLSVG